MLKQTEKTGQERDNKNGIIIVTICAVIYLSARSIAQSLMALSWSLESYCPRQNRVKTLDRLQGLQGLIFIVAWYI